MDVERWCRKKLLAPLRWGSDPMKDSCQLLTEGCWFIPSNNLFLQLWKLTAIYMYNQIRLEQWRKTPIHLTSVE